VHRNDGAVDVADQAVARTTLGISSCALLLDSKRRRSVTRAVSQPGSLRSASLQAPSARPCSSNRHARRAHADGISPRRLR